MPKTTINEIDKSRFSPAYTAAPMTVLVPGTASFGPVATAEVPEVTLFAGEGFITDFYSKFGTAPAQLYDSKLDMSKTITGDFSFEYASNLISSGANVVFMRLNQGEVATAEITDEISVSAKYSGSFGNHIACKFEPISYTHGSGATSQKRTDLYLSIYISSYPFKEANAINKDGKAEDVIKKWNPIFFTRVSPYFDSKYYVDSSTNLEYISLDADTVSAIVNKIGKGSNLIINLGGGRDFTNDTAKEEDAIKQLIDSLRGSKDGLLSSAFSLVTDPYLFDFDFVTCPIIFGDEQNMSDLHNAMKGLAESRGDCIALIDTPENYKYNEVSNYAQNFNTSYAAIYAPWCSINSEVSGREVMVPPSLIFLKSILYNMATASDPQIWYVPAGISRASAPFIVSPKYEIGSVILDTFQNNHAHRVNPIMKVRNYGYCVYGNATAKHQVSTMTHSSLECMNVRLIANAVKKHIFDVCSLLSFEYNNSELWLKFYTLMDEKLLFMKRNYGLYDYKIIMDNSTVTQEAMNERRVPGKVMISPTLAGEFFDIDFEITPSGVSFDEEDED